MAMNETSTYVPDHDVVGTMPVYSEPETYLAGALVAKRSVVGRVTASGKLKLSVKTATDGSQKPIGIAVRDVDATAGDAIGPTFKAGVFDPTTLVIDPSFGAEDVRLAFEGSPLFIRTPLPLSTY